MCFSDISWYGVTTRTEYQYILRRKAAQAWFVSNVCLRKTGLNQGNISMVANVISLINIIQLGDNQADVLKGQMVKIQFRLIDWDTY